jgi:NAD-specific glutamate dehydrogenase
VLEIAKNEGGNFGRRELSIAQADSHDAAALRADARRHFEREQSRVGLDIIHAFAHEAFHGVDGADRVGQQATLRFAPDVDRAVRGGRHDGRHERVAALVADDDGRAVLDERDEAVGGAEINSDNSSHDFRRQAAISRSMVASRLLM